MCIIFNHRSLVGWPGVGETLKGGSVAWLRELKLRVCKASTFKTSEKSQRWKKNSDRLCVLCGVHGDVRSRNLIWSVGKKWRNNPLIIFSRPWLDGGNALWIFNGCKSAEHALKRYSQLSKYARQAHLCMQKCNLRR